MIMDVYCLIRHTSPAVQLHGRVPATRTARLAPVVPPVPLSCHGLCVHSGTRLAGRTNYRTACALVQHMHHVAF